MKTTIELLKKELEQMNDILSMISDENIEEINNEGINLIETIMNKQIVEDVSSKFIQWYSIGSFRRYVIQYMGFALITKKFARDLAKYIGNNKCLEIMSGQGCLAKSLQDEGVNVIATDNYSWKHRLDMSNAWTNIEQIDCLDAIRKYGKDVSYILCSWIPYEDSIGYEALKLMSEVNPNCKMIVIGEGQGGCTADDLFFENLEEVNLEDCENKDFIRSFRSWEGIHDYVSVVKFKNN